MITSENAATYGIPFDSFTAPIAGQLGGLAPHKSRGRKSKRAQVNAMPDDEKARYTVIERQLRLVREQVKHTRARLNDDNYAYCEHCERSGMPDNHRAQLLKALDSLLERECDLLSIPRRAVNKASNTPRKRPWTGESGPTPIPNTTIPSVPAQPNVISNPNPLTDNKSD